MSVGRICTRTVVTAAPGEPIIDVVRRMERNNVGAVVVVNEDARPVGIVTDRDVALRCVAGEHDPRDAVSVIMTREVRSVDESTPIEQALRTMSSGAMRRLVVTGEGGRVAGMLSVDDVIELIGEEVASIADLIGKEAPQIAG